MAAQGTDLLLVERGGVLYKLTANEIAALGGGGGGTPAVTVPVTFPAYGSKVITQTVSVPGATVGQKVFAVPHNDTDELEMDMLTCAGLVTALDTVRLTVTSVGQAHAGIRNINIQVS
jgi:hypothetical protein